MAVPVRNSEACLTLEEQPGPHILSMLLLSLPLCIIHGFVINLDIFTFGFSSFLLPSCFLQYLVKCLLVPPLRIMMKIQAQVLQRCLWGWIKGFYGSAFVMFQSSSRTGLDQDEIYFFTWVQIEVLLITPYVTSNNLINLRTCGFLIHKSGMLLTSPGSYEHYR